MITAALMTIAAFSIGIATVQHWKEILQWLREIVTSFLEILSQLAIAIANAAFVFVKIMSEAIAGILHKQYYEENGEIVEKTTTRKLLIDKLPGWVKKKIGTQEKDITEEIEEELKLKI